ncbi:MAG: phosphomannomutase/phosphoglucomutase [Phycisphaerales bacterium]
MLGKVFKAYDIRATYPKPLNEKLAWQIGYATAQYLTDNAAEAGFDDPMMRHIVVGRDMRKSGPSLCTAFKKGIRDAGAHVIDLGKVDTPMIYFAINYLSCAGGAQTTASHNPANYNGFKISKLAAKPVGEETGLAEIRRLAAMASQDKVTPRGGREESRDLWEPYAQHVRSFLSPALLDGAKTIKVVIDASNGMAGTMVPRIFADVPGLDITRINFDNSTGEFEHEPNPLVEANLEELKAKVREIKADFGICFDGDADRLVVVDERGTTIGCDHLTAWLSARFLKQTPGSSIVYDLRSSKSLPEMIEEAGGRPVKSRVGHVYMKQKLADERAIFGGELSGHFYFRDNFNADSGAIAFAAVASAYIEDGRRLSTQIKPSMRYAQSGEINFRNEEKEATLNRLRNTYPDARVEELDGVTLDHGQWWCNVRMSNTEPLLRLNLEGADADVVSIALREVSRYLGERVNH